MSFILTPYHRWVGIGFIEGSRPMRLSEGYELKHPALEQDADLVARRIAFLDETMRKLESLGSSRIRAAHTMVRALVLLSLFGDSSSEQVTSRYESYLIHIRAATSLSSLESLLTRATGSEYGITDAELESTRPYLSQFKYQSELQEELQAVTRAETEIQAEKEEAAQIQAEQDAETRAEEDAGVVNDGATSLEELVAMTDLNPGITNVNVQAIADQLEAQAYSESPNMPILMAEVATQPKPVKAGVPWKWILLAGAAYLLMKERD